MKLYLKDQPIRENHVVLMWDDGKINKEDLTYTTKFSDEKLKLPESVDNINLPKFTYVVTKLEGEIQDKKYYEVTNLLLKRVKEPNDVVCLYFDEIVENTLVFDNEMDVIKQYVAYVVDGYVFDEHSVKEKSLSDFMPKYLVGSLDTDATIDSLIKADLIAKLPSGKFVIFDLDQLEY